MWSYGITLYCLLFGIKKEIFAGFQAGKFEIPSYPSSRIPEIIRSCIKIAPKDRVDWKKIISTLKTGRSPSSVKEKKIPEK